MNVKCCLCGQRCNSFSKSHLIPRGFLAKSEFAHDMSLISERHPTKRLRNGVYDCNILCKNCEHAYFQDPDDYGIKIYRDLTGAAYNSVLASNGQVARWWLFPCVDRRRLRAFIASVLWRCSVSEQECVSKFKLSGSLEKQIADDLMKGGSFDYVDAVALVCTTTNLPEEIRGIGDSIILPQRMRLRYQSSEAEGVALRLPKVHFYISLGSQKNPYAATPDGMDDPVGIFEGNSTSISGKHNGKGLILYEGDYPEHLVGSIVEGVRKTKNVHRSNCSSVV